MVPNTIFNDVSKIQVLFNVWKFEKLTFSFSNLTIDYLDGYFSDYEVDLGGDTIESLAFKLSNLALETLIKSIVLIGPHGSK